MIYASNPYGYYETMKDERNYQEQRKAAYQSGQHCNIQPDDSLGEGVKNYYRRHGYV